MPTSETLIADNRKAFHDYHILETFEVDITLLGTEVKGGTTSERRSSGERSIAKRARRSAAVGNLLALR